MTAMRPPTGSPSAPWSADQQTAATQALQEGLEQVQRRLAAACLAAGRPATAVRLVPVSKTLPVACGPALLAALRACGLPTVGENRLDHCVDLLAGAPDLAVEHIGRLQSRQLTKLPPQVTTVHAVAEERHVLKLARVASEQERHFSVYVQVNTSGEVQKAGVSPDALGSLLATVRQHEAVLSLQGLMTMAPDADLPEVHDEMIAHTFQACRDLADRHGLQQCSMGMSKDLELAVAAGATVVRIGTDCWQPAQALFDSWVA